MRHLLILVILCFASFAGSFRLAAEEPCKGRAIMRETLLAYYYSGSDAQARISLRLLDHEGHTRTRRLTMLRLDQADGGKQFYYIYFYEPPDVRGMSFLVSKHPGRDDDRWLYLPSIDLVKRIATSDKRTSFAGSDFTYEDVSGRDLDEDEHELLGEEALGEYSTFVVKSTPKRSREVEFSVRKFWIDKTTRLPLKVEHYDLQGALYKIYETREIRTIQDFPTITKAVMKDLGSGHETEITIEAISYDAGLTPDLFQERFLRRPPTKWIR